MQQHFLDFFMMTSSPLVHVHKIWYELNHESNPEMAYMIDLNSKPVSATIPFINCPKVWTRNNMHA